MFFYALDMNRYPNDWEHIWCGTAGRLSTRVVAVKLIALFWTPKQRKKR